MPNFKGINYTYISECTKKNLNLICEYVNINNQGPTAINIIQYAQYYYEGNDGSTLIDVTPDQLLPQYTTIYLVIGKLYFPSLIDILGTDCFEDELVCLGFLSNNITIDANKENDDQNDNGKVYATSPKVGDIIDDPESTLVNLCTFKDYTPGPAPDPPGPVPPGPAPSPGPAPDPDPPVPTTGIIPDVRGFTEERAIEILKDNNFTSVTIDTKIISNPTNRGITGIPGNIATQSPVWDGKKYYSFSEKINLRLWDILKGELPDLIGLSKENAEEILKKTGFNNISIGDPFENNISSEQNGRIFEQEPVYDTTGQDNKYDLTTQITLHIYSDYVSPINPDGDRGSTGEDNTGDTGDNGDDNNNNNTKTKNTFLNVVLITLAIGVLIAFFYFLFMKNKKVSTANFTQDLLF